MGSSPHTRGAPRRSGGRARRSRIIPAYAGSTVSLLVSHFRPSDHPRIRGEHNPCGHSPMRPWGSSPHTRGAPVRCLSRGCRKRIIPAYAGSTAVPLVYSRRGTDHPRIRGEHDRDQVATVGLEGSSPHTRGARWLSAMPSAVRGIIPAYAGSTRHPVLVTISSQDHPRIRGEHEASIA